MDLFAYIIYTSSLTNRHAQLKSVIGSLRGVATGLKTNFITHKDPALADPKPVYDKTGDAEFDRHLTATLTTEQLSNIEKHREAWRRIAASRSGGSSRPGGLVIEDDAFFAGSECINAFTEALREWEKGEFDIVFLGVCSPGGPGSEAKILQKVSDGMRIMPAKEAYFISSECAAKLLKITETVTFPMRIELSWALARNPEIRVACPTKRVSLDGSKVGLYPSSVHANNILTYNKEYMDLMAFANKPVVEIKANLSNIRSIFKIIEHMHNPDAMHLYGVLLFKAGLLEDACEVLNNAILEMEKQKGLLSNRSELLNNMINMQEFIQREDSELAECLSKPSKYSDAILL